MARTSVLFLLISLAGLILFVTGVVPTAWVESVHARGLFPLLGFLLSTPFSALPFSVTEALIVVMALAILAGLGVASFAPAPIERGGRLGAWKRLGMRALLLVALLVDLYLVGFGWLYQRAPLGERLALPAADTVAANFEPQALELARLARSERVPLPERPDLAELSAQAYASLAAVLPELGALPMPAARLKPAIPDGLLLHFSISGVFSPFTQECHLDPGLDPLMLPFVAVHELAHLAGFAPEDEANFVAWLACSRSRDPWFRYSGHVVTMIRFENQSTGKLRRTLAQEAGEGVQADRIRARRKARRHRNPTLSKIAWKTYDGLLRSQGVSHGIRSYDLMTRLVLSWKARTRQPSVGR